jgi:hypothetical protein
LKIFPFAAGADNTWVLHHELRISPQIFEKILNGPTGAWGKLIHEKNLTFRIWDRFFKATLHDKLSLTGA